MNIKFEEDNYVLMGAVDVRNVYKSQKKSQFLMKYFILFVFFLISIEIHAQLNDFKNINFTKADSIAKLYNGKNLKNLPLLTYNLTINLETDVEKFRAIYSWICMNIKADYYMYKRINNARKRHKKDNIAYAIWNKNYSKKVFKRLLNNKKQCVLVMRTY